MTILLSTYLGDVKGLIQPQFPRKLGLECVFVFLFV
jgi:hypothetical protein